LRLLIIAATLFLSAFLLFVCQPMVGKMFLPYLGGTAAVWTTCVLFFQFMLLVGYVYAHFLARISDMRTQLVIHGTLLLLPVGFLPIRFGAAPTESFSQHPSLQLLAGLMTSTAIPFFVVATTAPLVQNWLSRTTHRASSDPYFLYSVSNAGSLLALAAYPLVIEPQIGAASQSQLWFAGYIALIVMFALTVAALREAQAREREASRDERHWATSMEQAAKPAARIDAKTRLFWIAASFIPSGLMLAVTNHIAANVASVPFLWLLPLALYLLTFIFAFGRRLHASSTRVSRLIPIVLLGVFPLVAAQVVAPPGLNWIVIGLHLLLLFVGALLCHTRLAESRPGPQQLTEFYFWVALGGVLGGVFTATLAPIVFSTVLEYPLLVATLPFFRGGKFKISDLLIAAGFAVGLVTTWIIFLVTHLDSNTEAVALAHTVVLFAGYKVSRQPERFAWLFLVFIAAYTMILPGYIEGANRVYATRNFFGVKKVLDDPALHLRKLLHGDTTHGIESTDPARVEQPLSYYYRGGSVSDVIEMMRGRRRTQRFAVLGLGAGTMASYADAAHHMTFYEIDPSVEPIARRYFTFLSRCGSNCDVVIGDGRLQLAREADDSFDLILLDAFSSDSVPTHLLSREALEMYLAKLKPDGVLLFHVSNRYLNVAKLVSALVTDAGLTAFSRFDDAGDLRKVGKSSANHVAAAREAKDLKPLAALPGWEPVPHPADFRPWTDDYSSLLGLIRWH
jgi:SAM-dependent methyltransferase